MRNLKICVTVLAACLWIFTATDAAAQKSDTVRVGDETYWGLNEDSLRRKGEQRILEDYKFTNNLWFQFLAGVYNNWGSNQKHHFGLKHFRPSVGIAVGKWFHPTVGARLVLDYGSNRGVSVGKGIVDPRGYTIPAGLRQSHHWHTIELAGDAMINLSNLFFRYNENRVFNFIVFFGIGGNQTFGFSDRERAFSLKGGYDTDTKQQYEGYQKDNCTLLTFRAGAMATWRIGEKWDLSFEVSNNWVDDSYDGVYTHNRTDGHVNAYVGLIRRLRYGDQYNFRFRRYEASQVARMNDEVNKLRERTQYALNNIPTERVYSKQINTIVSFKQGSWELNELQEVNIYTAVQKMKQYKQAMPFYIVPLVTGTTFNEGTFKKRVETIREDLMKQYNIPEHLIYDRAEPERIEELSKSIDCIIIYVNENKN